MRDRWILAGLLLLTVLLRLPYLAAPIADHLQAKQSYTALRARAISRPPFNPLRQSLDLLDDQGQAVRLVEEVPLYCTLVALCHRLFGEQNAWARLVSLAGSLLAVAAFYDLVRRRAGQQLAAVAALLFTAAPLFVFYGRAVMPDSWMLALMITAAALYQRYLGTGSPRGWLGAAVCAALATLFKYYGLMILVVLAQMTVSVPQSGFSALFRRRFLLLLTIVLTPVTLWMGLVFFQNANPLVTGWVPGTEPRPYLVFQDPSVFFNPALYTGLWRFLTRDLGPISAALLTIGLISAVRRRTLPEGFGGLLAGWGILAIGFYLILGPKLIDHDYYELMMLPAVALGATLGWRHIVTRISQRWNSQTASRWGAGLLALVVVVQSPWLMGEHFRPESGKLQLTQAIRQAVPSNGRVLFMSPSIGLISVLYESHRQGWTVPMRELDAHWPDLVNRYRSLGATTLAVYFDAKTTPEQRQSFKPMIEGIFILRHGRSQGTNHQDRYEYVLLNLD